MSNRSFILGVPTTYAQVVNIKDTHLREARLNMLIGKASDPDNVDKTVPHFVLYKPPNDPKKVVRIENHRCYTMISIPFETLANTKDEETWIKATIERVLRGIRTIMSSDAFRGILEKVGESRQASYVAKLYSAHSKSNLPKFLNGALIRVLPVRFFTDHLIQNDSNEIMTQLWQSRLAKPKYNVEGDHTDDRSEERRVGKECC